MKMEDLKKEMDELAENGVIASYDFDDLEYDYEMVIDKYKNSFVSLYVFKVDEGIALVEEEIIDEFTGIVKLDTFRLAKEEDIIEIKKEMVLLEQSLEWKQKQLNNMKNLLA